MSENQHTLLNNVLKQPWYHNVNRKSHHNIARICLNEKEKDTTHLEAVVTNKPSHAITRSSIRITKNTSNPPFPQSEKSKNHRY